MPSPHVNLPLEARNRLAIASKIARGMEDAKRRVNAIQRVLEEIRREYPEAFVFERQAVKRTKAKNVAKLTPKQQKRNEARRKLDALFK